MVALTTGYRVPAAVVEIANRLLKPLDVSVPPTTSFRSDGQLTITRVDDLAVGLRRPPSKQHSRTTARSA